MMNNTTYLLNGCPSNVTVCDVIRQNALDDAKDHGTLMKTSFGLIASLSFFANLLLCLVIFMKRSMLNKPYNILICSLAVTDMLTGMRQKLLIIFCTFLHKLEGLVCKRYCEEYYLRKYTYLKISFFYEKHQGFYFNFIKLSHTNIVSTYPFYSLLIS